MEEINGETIFWLFSIGLVIGALFKLLMGSEKGLSMTSNIIGGVLGTIIVGVLGIKVQMPGSLMLGVLGAMSILFLGNVFYMEDDDHTHDVEQPSV